MTREQIFACRAMEKVKELLDSGELTPNDLKTLLTCKECNCDAPVFNQETPDQRSEGWHRARSGRVTASDCAAVCVSSLMLVATDCLCMCICILTGILCGSFLIGGITV